MSLKTTSWSKTTSQGYKLVSALPMVLLCTKFSETLFVKLILQLLNRNYFQMTLNILCDLQNFVKVIRFELGLRNALMLLCTKFGEDTSNGQIFLEILSGNHLSYANP